LGDRARIIRAAYVGVMVMGVRVSVWGGGRVIKGKVWVRVRIVDRS